MYVDKTDFVLVTSQKDTKVRTPTFDGLLGGYQFILWD